MKNNIKKYIPYIVTYFVIFILLFIQHNVVHMYFDDFGNASLSYAKSVENVVRTNFTFKQLFDEAIYTYFNFGGRILYGMIVTLLLKNGIKPFMILQVFVILGIFYMISSIVTKITKKKSVMYPIICMILYMLFDISLLNNGIYWASASILYLWPMLPFFTLINYYLKITDQVKHNKNINYLKFVIISFILIVLSVFSQEQIGVGLIIFFIVFIFFNHFKDIKKYLKYDLFVIISSIITYLFLFFAPGNWVRMDTHNSYFTKLSFFEKIRYNYPRIIQVLFKYKANIFMNILIFVLLVFVIYYFIKNYKKGWKNYLLLIPIVFLIFNYIMYDKHIYYPSKLLTMVGTCILISMLIIIILYYYKKKRLEYIAFSLTAAGTLFCLLMSPAINKRSCIPCLLILFIPIISISFEMLKTNRTIYVLLIISFFFLTYRGIDNYFTIYQGYKSNYNIMNRNYYKLDNYKQYEKNNSIVLCKVKKYKYGSEQSYKINYDYWLQEYFDLPKNIKMKWVDCNEKD